MNYGFAPSGKTILRVQVGEKGLSYRFRVRAIDNVGNTSAWVESETATVQTTVTKYYYLAGQRVAMRQGSALTYLYGDHLGSTSLITNASGAVVAETRYLPYGQAYWQSGASQTDFTFTGQRLDGFGLMDYKARYYDPYLGRFLSPDDIVSNLNNPLDWDRYAYVQNNPINFTDPSGNKPCVDIGDNGECVTDPIWSQMNGLSEEASLIKYGYEMAKSMKGYWNDNGKSNFSVNDFLGLFSFWEIASLRSGKQDDNLKEATARRIYGRGYCTGGCSSNQIYTFLSENGGSVQFSRINAMLKGSDAGHPSLRGGTYGSLMDTARDWGDKILNTLDWRETNNNRPSNWGNAGLGAPYADKIVANLALAQSRGEILNIGGMGITDIVEWNENFVILTANQESYWLNYE